MNAILKWTSLQYQSQVNEKKKHLFDSEWFVEQLSSGSHVDEVSDLKNVAARESDLFNLSSVVVNAANSIPSAPQWVGNLRRTPVEQKAAQIEE